jgi:hypothetical protein
MRFVLYFFFVAVEKMNLNLIISAIWSINNKSEDGKLMFSLEVCSLG